MNVEGPYCSESHKWYARVTVVDGKVSGLKGFATGVIGNCSGLQGDFDNCEISIGQSISINNLIER